MEIKRESRGNREEPEKLVEIRSSGGGMNMRGKNNLNHISIDAYLCQAINLFNTEYKKQLDICIYLN